MQEKQEIENVTCGKHQQEVFSSLYSYTNYGKKVLTVMANNSTIQQIELYQLSVQLTEHKIDHDIWRLKSMSWLG